MLSDPQIEKVALFYFFTFLDELKAQSATVRTLKKINTIYPTDAAIDDAAFLKTFVRETYQFITKSSDESGTNQLSVVSSHIEMPLGANWGPWFEYRRVGQQREFLMVLYHHILKVPIDIIGEALDLPRGTVTYRIARGLKQLGDVCQQGGVHA